jgi:hypothetical protein
LLRNSSFCIFEEKSLNEFGSQADGSTMPASINTRAVMCHPIQHPTHIQIRMTLPPDPSLFLAHGKAQKTPTQSQPCKELKMPTHNPPTPADEYLSSAVQHIGNISFFDTMPTHHPFDRILKNSVTTPCLTD